MLLVIPPSPRLGSQILAMSVASAAVIPSELITPIVVYACKSATARQLRHLALVCRYWTSVVRLVTLVGLHWNVHSKSSLDKLFSILAPPSHISPSLFDCITADPGWIIDATYTGSWSGVWLRLHSPCLPEPRQVELNSVSIPSTAANSRSKVGYAPWSWSVGLPRTLPPNAMRLSTLSLVGVCFERIDHVVSLVDHVTGLRRLSCVNLKFDNIEEPPMPSRVRRPREQTSGLRLDVSGCGSDALNLQILTGIIAYSSNYEAPGYVLGIERWRHVHALLVSLLPRPWRRDDRRILSLSRYNSHGVQSMLFVLPSYDISLHYRLSTQPLSFAQPATRVLEAVEIAYTSDTVLEAYDTYWSAFQTAILSLDIAEGALLRVRRYPDRLDVSEKIFPWFIKAATQYNGSLAPLYRSGHLRLIYDRILDLRAIDVPEVHFLKRDRIVLDPPQRFKLFCSLLGLDGKAAEDAKEEFLRTVTRATSHPTSTGTMQPE